jgi:hypothetical protein
VSYFDCSDAEGVDFGNWVEEHEEERRELASLEAAGVPATCDHCGEPEAFNVLCPDCEQLCCTSCGRVECCCETTAADDHVCPVCGEDTYGYAPCACPDNDADDEREERQCRACRAWVRYTNDRGYCINCENDDAADGGEENDDMEHDPDDTGFNLPLHKYPPMGLVSMRNAIDLELKQRRDALAKELAATEHALNGTRPRATRRDKGSTRAQKASAA